MAKKSDTGHSPAAAPGQARFETLIGHESVADYLRQAHASGRMPQTVVFDGPPGVGKSAMAFAMAKFLLSGGAESGNGFDRHARKVEADPPIHPDLRILSPSGAAGQIRIDTVREAADSAWQMPIEGARRVLIIDPADRLNVASANSLLKLLEEPPALLSIILATESIHAILPTIRSRAARLRLHPLADEAVAQWLHEKHGIEPKLARVAAVFAGGCPGQALEQASGKAISDRDTLIAEWQFFQKHGMLGLFRVASNLGAISQPMESLLGAWIAWLRDALVAATSPGRDDLLINADRRADLAEEAGRLGPRVLGRCIECLIAARADARRMISRPLFFEALLLRLGPEIKRASAQERMNSHA